MSFAPLLRGTPAASEPTPRRPKRSYRNVGVTVDGDTALGERIVSCLNRDYGEAFTAALLKHMAKAAEEKGAEK